MSLLNHKWLGSLGLFVDVRVRVDSLDVKFHDPIMIPDAASGSILRSRSTQSAYNLNDPIKIPDAASERFYFGDSCWDLLTLL